MPYILPASQASLISAGETLPEHDRAVQECLSLIEIEIREAASEGLNKVHLLLPRFAGWDKNNLASGPAHMPAVFAALLANGYGYFTEPGVPIHESMRRPMVVPYVHTSVTWGKMVVVNKTSRDNKRGVMAPPESIIIETDDLRVVTQEGLDEQIRKRDYAVGEWVLEPKALSEGQLMSVKKDFDADSMNENIAPVCISKDAPPVPESDLGADEAYFREATTYAPAPPPPPAPMPGNPAQLINFLHNRGFALKGFGVPAGYVHKPQAPYSWETQKVINKVTASLLESHLRGVHERRMCAIEFDPSRVEVTRILEDFKNLGFDLIKPKSYGEFTYVWPVDAWDLHSSAPCQELSLPTSRHVKDLSKIAKFKYKMGKLGMDLSDVAIPDSLLEQEDFEGEEVTRKAYGSVLDAVVEAAKRGDNILQICLSLDCKVARIIPYLQTLGFACTSSVVPPTQGMAASQLLVVTWLPFK